MRKFVKLLIGIFGVIILGVTTAYACSCIGPNTPEERIAATQVIFFGKAIATIDEKVSRTERGYSSMEQSTNFSVIESWKGNPSPLKTLYHANGNNCCYCGLVFEPNQYYLILAHYTKDGKLTSSSCSGTEQVLLKTYENLAFDPTTWENELLKALTKTPSTKY